MKKHNMPDVLAGAGSFTAKQRAYLDELAVKYGWSTARKRLALCRPDIFPTRWTPKKLRGTTPNRNKPGIPAGVLNGKPSISQRARMNRGRG